MAEKKEKSIHENEDKEKIQTENAEFQPEEVCEEQVTISKEEYEKLIQAQKTSSDYFDQMLRIQAEFENYRKRVTKEKSEFFKYANEKIISEILPILDNFQRALDALEEHVTKENHKFFEGVEMIYRQLKNLMESQGVKQIESVGKPFDPSVHHAVQVVETDETAQDTVVQELAKGYILNDRVIRAATVIVSKPKQGSAEEKNGLEK